MPNETETICVCQTCDWEGSADDLGEIQDFEQRHDPDDIVAAGECPECGALAFEEPSRWAIRARYESLIEAAEVLVDSADGTGCSDDLTVVSAAALRTLGQLLEALRAP